MAQPLTADETTFLQRALPHFLAGKSVADSMAAVLEDDGRLLSASMSNRGCVYAGGNFSEGRSFHHDSNPSGTTLRQEIGRRVYSALRQAA